MSEQQVTERRTYVQKSEPHPIERLSIKEIEDIAWETLGKQEPINGFTMRWTSSLYKKLFIRVCGSAPSGNDDPRWDTITKTFIPLFRKIYESTSVKK